MDSTNVLKNLNNLYDKSGYITRYGLDLLTSIIICLIFGLVISYYHVMNNIQPIKNDWSNQRCSPSVMPFSGLISKSSKETVFEATNNNFTFCIQTILSNIGNYALQPFYYLLNTITSEFQSLIDAVESIRAEFDKIRNSVTDVGSDLFSRILNIIMPLLETIISVKDLIGKTMGTMTAGLYTFFGAYLSMQSLFLIIYNLVSTILYALVGIITISWLTLNIPLAIADTAIMGAVLVPMAVIALFMENILQIDSSPPLPKVPSCFAGDTIVELQNNKRKLFKNLEINDILSDGSSITAIMKLSSYEQEFYKLNGIIVTGNHSILCEEKGWISVDKHPESCLIENFREPFIYCVNTDTKTIKIGKNIFSDWDDLDDNDFNDLKNNCCNLPINYSKKDIHKYLDAGFDENTTIELEDGRSIKIKNIEINDILRFGECVRGIIKIKCSDMVGLSEYAINEDITFKCTSNILLKDLGNLNTFNLTAENTKFADFAYHLLTDKGSFIVNGISVGDYNTSIEKYLTSCSC